MNLLDEFRDGFVSSKPAVADSPLSFSERTRRTMWWLFGIMTVLAVAHLLIASGLSAMSGGQDLAAIGLVVLGWPAPAVQPVLCGTVAAAVVALAIATRGFARRGRAASATTAAATVAGVLAGLPTVLVIVAGLLIALLGAALIIVIVWLIFAAATS